MKTILTSIYLPQIFTLRAYMTLPMKSTSLKIFLNTLCKLPSKSVTQLLSILYHGIFAVFEVGFGCWKHPCLNATERQV